MSAISTVASFALLFIGGWCSYRAAETASGGASPSAIAFMSGAVIALTLGAFSCAGTIGPAIGNLG